MMRFSTLLKHPADWMSGPGDETAVVLTSRVRLARNLAGHSFPGWAKKADRGLALEVLRPLIEDLPLMRDGFSQELGDLDMLKKQVLVERHLISREQAARGQGSGAIINRKQTVCLMINEEDHLRIQAIRPGLSLEEAYEMASEIDQGLENDVDFAFDPKLGYLTACPTNVGTGMRASAMLHLPALVLGDHIGPVLKGIDKLGLAVRGLYGEGTESLGNLFQISNQSTLGQSEEEIIGQLEGVITEVARHEADARLKLLEDDPAMIRDQVGRAYGTLRHAHIVNSKEGLNLLSMLRLGADLAFFDPSMVEECDRMFMEIQPAHLQWLAGRQLDPEERDAERAEILRERLRDLAAPAKDISNNQNGPSGPENSSP